MIFRLKSFCELPQRKGLIFSPNIPTINKQFGSLSSHGDFSSSILNGFTGSIGNTPLIKLEKLSKESGCNILVKAEYMNPGGNDIICNKIFLLPFIDDFFSSRIGKG